MYRCYCTTVISASRPLSRLQSKLRLPSGSAAPAAVCPQHLIPLHLSALQMSQLKADPAQLKGVHLIGSNIACVSAGAPLSAFKMMLSRLAMQSPTMSASPQRSLLAHSAAKLQRLRLQTYLTAVQLASVKARLSAGGAAGESTGIRIAQMELKLKKLQTRLAKAEARHAAMQQQHSTLKFKLPAAAADNFDTQGQWPSGTVDSALGCCACMDF